MFYQTGEEIARFDRVRYEGDGSTGIVQAARIRTNRVRILWDRGGGRSIRIGSVSPDRLTLIERNGKPEEFTPPPPPPFQYAGGEKPHCNDRVSHLASGRIGIVQGIKPAEGKVYVRWPDYGARRATRPAEGFRLISRGGMWKEDQDD